MNKKIQLIGILAVIVLLIIISITYFGKKEIIDNSSSSISKEDKPFLENEKKKIELFKELRLSTDKNVYGPNEEIKVTGIVYNSFLEDKKWQIICYLMSLDEGFSTVGEVEDIHIKPGYSEKSEFIILVSENLAPDNYLIKIEVREGNRLISTKSQVIEIGGTKKKIDASIMICDDQDCYKEKSVFLPREPIYVKIKTEKLANNVDTNIRYSGDDKWKELEFENNLLLFDTTRVGTYEILLTIRDEEYQNLNLHKEFVVIGAVPEIKNASKCNPNGKCEAQENSQNCPQDCYY